MNILITGGASGLGEAITAAAAADTGNIVYFTYFRSGENAAQLEKKYPNARGIYCDLTDPQSLGALLQKMETLALQVLVNNAFMLLEVAHFHKMQPGSFSASFDRNIAPVAAVMQKAVELFRRSKYGKIVTILSSAVVSKPPAGWSRYTAEKNYLLSLCKSVAVENAAFHISSNCISPSFMLTELTKQTDERIIEEMTNRHPLKKLLTTAETAETVLFLVRATQQINGANIIINAAADLA